MVSLSSRDWGWMGCCPPLGAFASQVSRLKVPRGSGLIGNPTTASWGTQSEHGIMADAWLHTIRDIVGCILAYIIGCMLAYISNWECPRSATDAAINRTPICSHLDKATLGVSGSVQQYLQSRCKKKENF